METLFEIKQKNLEGDCQHIQLVSLDVEKLVAVDIMITPHTRLRFENLGDGTWNMSGCATATHLRKIISSRIIFEGAKESGKVSLIETRSKCLGSEFDLKIWQVDMETPWFALSRFFKKAALLKFKVTEAEVDQVVVSLQGQNGKFILPIRSGGPAAITLEIQ